MIQTKLLEPEKKCPECKGLLDWKVIRGKFGESTYNGLCKKCNIVIKNRETPDLKKGRLMAKDLVGVGCMDKRITKHNGDVQLGILRALMHCATCENNYGDPCLCTNCDCPYCRDCKK